MEGWEPEYCSPQVSTMSVFARSKLTIYDTCFVEDPGEVELKYVGPNVHQIYKKAYELIKSVWKAADSDIQEENYNWGKGEEDKFSMRWNMHRDVDKFTYFWVRFTLKGQGTDKMGKASLVIRPVLITEYPQDTVWQRSLIYEMLRTFWHRAFYHGRRIEYFADCRNLTALYAKKVKDFFNQLMEETK